LKKQFELGPLSEFPPDSCRILDVGRLSIGVYNTNGEVYAVRNLCPHRLAPICRGTLGGTFLPSRQGEWIYGLEGYVLRCVAHAWEFDIRTGESVMMADRRRLATYPVTVEDGKVLVTLRVRENEPEKAGGDDAGQF
jgi:nitrite reductase/ring-hydroxylating ferredoxin subunit